MPPFPGLLCPPLTSGDSSPRFSAQVALRQIARSPRVLHTHFPAYDCRIYVAACRARIGLCIYWPAYPAASLPSASCSSSQRFAFSFFQIPPRGGHPCCSANTSPCRVCRGLAPLIECALPGAPMEKGLCRSQRPFEFLRLPIRTEDQSRSAWLTAGQYRHRCAAPRSCARFGRVPGPAARLPPPSALAGPPRAEP